MARPEQVYHSQGDAIYHEENALQYREGGYHPVSLGDTFNNRYTIVHKLGFGSFGTVWLAEDKHAHRWVSLKILRADQTNRELENHTRIELRLRGDLSKGNIVQLLDHFLHVGVNGVHQCLVLELLGPSVSNFWYAGYDCHPDTEEIFMMTLGLLEGIVAVHQAGYAFGDLNTSNFAFAFGNVPGLSKREILSILGPPEENHLRRTDGQPLGRRVPSRLVSTARFVDWPAERDQGYTCFRLLDLGSAFPINERRKYQHQSTAIQPPECFFSDTVGYEADLWSLGLMIYWFIFLDYPFAGYSIEQRPTAFAEFLGPLPTEWTPKWTTHEATLRRAERTRSFEVGVDFQDRFSYSTQDRDSDVSALLPVIQGLMRLKPEERDSAEQALDSVTRICQTSKSEILRDMVPLPD